MGKRLTCVLVFLVLATGSALAEKKGAATVRLSRVEGEPVEMLFNPTELAVDKSVPWQKAPTSEGDAPDLEFTSADGRSLSFELVFDTFETKEDVHAKFIAGIEQLTLIDPNLKRPPLVKVVWGPGTPAFKGVIESLSVRYTLFLPDGTPCRATVNLKIKEASRASAPPRG